VEEENEKYTKMLTRVIANCDQMYKCMRLFKRTETILEIQEGSPTKYSEMACSMSNFDEKQMTYTTLFKENIEKRPCPINGIHNVTELDLDGQSETCEDNGFTNINIKCGDTEVIEFYKECPNMNKLGKLEVTSSSVYHCLGGWQEQIPLRELPNPYNPSGFYFTEAKKTKSGRRSDLFVSDDHRFEADINVTIGYLIAMRQKPPLSDVEEELKSGSEPPKRICFIYSKMNDLTYSWTVDKTSCIRNIRPGSMGRQRFNTTVLETCTGQRAQEEVRWLLLAMLWLRICKNL